MDPAGPIGAVCQPRHRLAHQPGVTGKAADVKLQVPAVVKLQLVLTGYFRHAPEVDNILVHRAFVAQVHKPEVQPSPGGPRHGRGGVGGGVQDDKHPVAGTGLDRGVQGGKQLPFQGDQPVPLIIEGRNRPGVQGIVQNIGDLAGEGHPLGRKGPQLLGQLDGHIVLLSDEGLVQLLVGTGEEPGHAEHQEQRGKHRQDHGDPVEHQPSLHPHALPPGGMELVFQAGQLFPHGVSSLLRQAYVLTGS